ncbi:MAG: preprotein translocase subunit SecE [Candidatus Atribacteria bacterium]|nr:preprotein translocase subunit SecE [Candidatus Atribacteria bacterium]
MKIVQLFKKLIDFVKESRAELKRVTWPNRKQLISSTVVVILMIALIAVFLGVVDLVFSRIVTIILQQ